MKLRILTLLGSVLALGLMSTLAWAANIGMTILLVNDLDRMSHDKAGRGGFAKLASIVKEERAKHDNMLLLHAGDAISPSLLSSIDKGEHIIALMNNVGFDYFAPGNHEFDFGPEVFLQRYQESEFPYLAANLRLGDGEPIKGMLNSAIRVYGQESDPLGHVKIGIVGLAADNAYVKSSPGNLKIGDALEIGASEARKLREMGADIVIGLTHSDRAQDMAIYNARIFDIVLTGDDHDLAILYDGRTLLMEGKGEAELIPAVDLDISVTERRGKRRVRWWPGFRVLDTAGAQADPDMMAAIKTYENKLSQELDVEIGVLAHELDSRRASVRTGETIIGNVIAEAMRAAVDADIGLTNGGGIRGDKIYASGTNLLRRDVLAELPFGNKTVKLELTGAQLLTALENSVSRIEDKSGRFLQVAGMRMAADITRPAGSRVTDVTIAGKALEMDATYTVATNDFLARGGDGFGIFRNGKTLIGKVDGKLMASQVIDYVMANGGIDAKLDGRVAIKQ